LLLFAARDRSKTEKKKKMVKKCLVVVGDAEKAGIFKEFDWICVDRQEKLENHFLLQELNN
jgi:hypothetical protein